MGMVLKIVVFVIGVLFLLIGLLGLFQPAQLAGQLGFELPTPESMGSARAMLGAHYVAMGTSIVLAILINRPALLFPIGLIEAFMVVARGIAAVNGELAASAVGPTILEVIAAGIMISLSWRAVFGR